MGLDNLHDMSLGQNYKALTDMVATPVGTFICPSRRQTIAYPYQLQPRLHAACCKATRQRA